MKKKYMIFHAPFPLDYNAKSASGIRPVKILKAFGDLGYEVIEVTGTPAIRMRKMILVKREIEYGKKIDFMYTESLSSTPTIMTGIPLRPFLDLNFFNFCKMKGIPIGLFYRDIYWRFPYVLRKQSAKIRFIAGIKRLFFPPELYLYRRSIDKLYVPSMGMAKYVGRFPNAIDELPPGCDTLDIATKQHKKLPSENINFIYVGGFGEHYRLHHVYSSIEDNESFNFTICTREKEWRSCCHGYTKGKIVPSNIRVTHLWGDDVKELYANADIAVVCVEARAYWEFAVPFKLFEYIGHHKPILASAGTYAGRYVQEMGIGWTIPYSRQAIDDFLNNITADEIERKKARVAEVAACSRWVDRAEKVARDMLEQGNAS